MSIHRLVRLRRALLALSAISTVWAVVVATTGGFFVHAGFLRVSSRDASTPALIALICAVAVYALARVPAARTTVREEWRWWSGPLLRGAATLRHPFAPAVAITLASVTLHVAYWLPAPPLWLDEEMLALNIRDRPFMDLPGALWFGQSAPLGWLVVQRALLLALGPGELALRLVPLIFGIATSAAALWVGMRWLTPAAAAVLVLLCSFGEWLSFFHFEMKHYSADAFWALLLPALAAWAAEDGGGGDTKWKWTRWWALAALAQWFANGAVLVTPACAILLFGVILRRHGARDAARFAAWGLLWLVSFGLHYELALRHASESNYLRSYWANAVPDPSFGARQTLGWIIGRLEPLARNPGGSAFTAGLWICAACGFAFSRRPLLGAMFATVPLSAFGLAAIGLVPLYERLSLWIVPALYAGVALLLDAALHGSWYGWRTSSWPRVVAGVAAASFVLWLSAGIFSRGTNRLLATEPDSNHGLDDRAAARWLMGARQPGDALLTTRLGWPALFWYGGIPVHPPAVGGRLPEGSVMYEVSHERKRQGCETQIQSLAGRHRRILVHVGFPDVPPGFYDLLLRELAALGPVAQSAQFAHDSRTAVIEVRGPPSGASSAPVGTGAGEAAALEGCIRVGPARRW